MSKTTEEKYAIFREKMSTHMGLYFLAATFIFVLVVIFS